MKNKSQEELKDLAQAVINCAKNKSIEGPGVGYLLGVIARYKHL